MEEPLANSTSPFTAGVVSRKSIQLPKNLILSWLVQRKRNPLVTGLDGRRNARLEGSCHSIAVQEPVML